MPLLRALEATVTTLVAAGCRPIQAGRSQLSRLKSGVPSGTPATRLSKSAMTGALFQVGSSGRRFPNLDIRVHPHTRTYACIFVNSERKGAMMRMPIHE